MKQLPEMEKRKKEEDEANKAKLAKLLKVSELEKTEVAESERKLEAIGRKAFKDEKEKHTKSTNIKVKAKLQFKCYHKKVKTLLSF